MPYCRKCGNKLSEGKAYCPSCGTPVPAIGEPRLAYWGERFVAWLIDIVILGAILTILKSSVFTASWPSFAIAPVELRWIPFVEFGLDNVIYFLYWMFLEGIYRRSIGKMIIHIKVTQLKVEHPSMGQAAIESIGKAFLLPIDCILGWIFYPKRRQRLFNYLSKTVVIKA